MDPYFDKSGAARGRHGRPLVSGPAAFWLALAVAIASFFAFAAFQPDAALAFLRGAGYVASACASAAWAVTTAVGNFLFWAAVVVAVILVVLLIAN